MDEESNYLRSKRGVIKISQIVIGIFWPFLACSLISSGGHYSCFVESTLTYASFVSGILLTLNIIVLSINIWLTEVKINVS